MIGGVPRPTPENGEHTDGPGVRAQSGEVSGEVEKEMESATDDAPRRMIMRARISRSTGSLQVVFGAARGSQDFRGSAALRSVDSGMRRR